MAATQHPSGTYTVGGQPDLSASKYEVKVWRTSRRVRDTDKTDQAGAFKAKLVFERRQLVIEFELEGLASAAPNTDFPKGAMCAITAYNKYWVEECNVEYSEDVIKVTGTLILTDFT